MDPCGPVWVAPSGNVVEECEDSTVDAQGGFVVELEQNIGG